MPAQSGNVNDVNSCNKTSAECKNHPLASRLRPSVVHGQTRPLVSLSSSRAFRASTGLCWIACSCCFFVMCPALPPASMVHSMRNFLTEAAAAAASGRGDRDLDEDLVRRP